MFFLCFYCFVKVFYEREVVKREKKYFIICLKYVEDDLCFYLRDMIVIVDLFLGLDYM